MCGSLFSPGTATSTYRPDPAASANINSLLSRINSVSQQPYQQYGGQLVAPLNDTQRSGIQHINDNYGVGQPYLNAASNYANAGAAPVGNLSSADINKYYSPYQQQVIDATMANINQTNAQQQNQVRGNAATAGALGGDRLAVAQSELARNQALAGNQTLAGLQSQGYQSAIQTALSQQANQQANANRQAQAAYTFGNLGSTAQNLGLQGASAQLQGGGVEQGNYQALLNSLYGQFQQAQAFPYQQLGWAGGLAGPLGGALGGTQTQQRASPSPFQVATGLGSLFGSFLKDGGRVYADGGRVPNFIADVGGYVPAMSPVQIPRPPISTSMGEPDGNPFALSPQQTKSIRNLGDDAGRMFGFSGVGGGNYSGSPESNSNLRPIGSPEGYAHGGLVHAVHAIRKSLRGYDDGGVVDPSDAERAYGMDLLRNGMAPAPRSPFRGDRLTEDLRNASGFEVVDPDTGATTASAGFAPMAPRPDLPPGITGEPAGGLPPGALAYAPTGAPQSPYGPPMTPQGQRFLDLVREQGQQAPPPPPPKDYNGPFADAAKLFGLNGGLSPEDRRSLRATGFGILAAPGGVSGWEALGQGGLKGLAEAQEARKEAEVSKQHETSAKFQRMNLERAAAQLAETISNNSRTFGETVRQHDIGASRPVTIGHTRDGTPILGIQDPKNPGRYSDPITGKPLEIDPQTGTVVPAGLMPPPRTQDLTQPRPTTVAETQPVEDIGLPPNARFAAGPAPSWVNEDVLNDPAVTPDDARLIRAIAEGRQKFLPLSRNNLRNRYIMGKVHEYDPQADEASFARRQRTENFFAVGTNGGGGQNIAAMNTWAQHMDEYLRLSQELNLGRFTSVNDAYNWLTSHGLTTKEAQAKLGALEVAAKAVADEGAKVFAGSGSALADREEWQKKFSVSTPAAVALSKGKEVEKLVEGRLNSLANQYNEGVRTNHDPAKFIAPKTREIIDRLKKTGDKYIPADSPEPPAASKKSAAERFQELTGGGLSKERAYKKMHEEGF